MTKPQLALGIGIISISVFPVLVKLELSTPIMAAFYRMAIAASLLVPYALFSKKLKLPSLKLLFPTLLCGLFYAMDVTVWNIAIHESTATQATLLTNLSPIWVGVGSFLFLTNKPKSNFWLGALVAVFGMMMLVGFNVFLNLNFNRAFFFAILSGMIYAAYMLTSKKVLAKTEVIPFVTISTLTSAIFLGILSLGLGESFTGYSNFGWLVFVIQGVVCQFLAWLLLGYATKNMETTRVSVSLLGQAILTGIFAWIFIGESITPRMAWGGLIILFGIRITFFKKSIPASIQDIRTIFTPNTRRLRLQGAARKSPRPVFRFRLRRRKRRRR